MERVLQKFERNPILTPADLPVEVLYAFNPGVVRYRDGYVMILNATTTDDIHRFWIARSQDGYRFTPDPGPMPMPPADPAHPETCTYDARITRIGEDYYVLYGSDLSQNQVRIGILQTRDFRHFTRVSTASELGNRNGALFPEKLQGLFCRLDRPFGNEQDPCSMWISYSPDLVFWGRSRPVTYRGKPFIDGFKMGAGAVPIRTEKGWLEIYHTVSTTCNGFIYRLKACLLDLEDPSIVIGYTKNFLLWPELDYEMRGRVSNVVFACNALAESDGTLKIYYGAADTNIGLAVGKTDAIIALCMENR
jgi:predicted GH43/DUF377 family glycosyl hydrolase